MNLFVTIQFSVMYEFSIEHLQCSFCANLGKTGKWYHDVESELVASRARWQP